MAGINRNFKTFYRTNEDPTLRPNRFVTVGLFERLDGSFEVTEHEGDTVPLPYKAEDEIAGVSVMSQQEAKGEFENRCKELASEGWVGYAHP